MRVAVLGAGGQLGHDLMRTAPDGVVAVPLKRPAFDAAADPALLAAALEQAAPDAVINCVAATRVDACETEVDAAVQVNARFAAEAARQCARLVHISTDYVFGGGPERAPLTEAAPRAPINVYGATKMLGEDLARLEHDDVLVVRVAALFGVAGASGKGGNFVETMLRLARERGVLRVVDDQTTSPTSTLDAAWGVWALLRAEAPAGAYHVANTGTATWRAFAQAIIEDARVSAEVQPIATADFPTPARRPAYSALDGRYAAAVSGYAPPPWRDALRAYLVEKGHR